jgi:CheY-like chemotaxis protein
MTGKHRRILLADDDLTCRIATASLIQKMGLGSVSVAQNGREALEMFQAEEFSIVLMDENMPVMDGIEATVGIRHCERQSGRPRTPVIALTACDDSSPQAIARFHDCGMDGCAAKPINPETLCRLLTPLPDAAPEKQDAVSFDRKERLQTTIDIEELKIIMCNSQALFTRCIAAFRKTGQPVLDTIGLDIAQKNSGNLKKSAHRLNGALRCIAARRAASLAEDLGKMALDDNLAGAAETYDSLVRECAMVLTELETTLNRNIMS